MGTLDGLAAHLLAALDDLSPLYIASTTLIALALTTYLWLFNIAYALPPGLSIHTLHSLFLSYRVGNRQASVQPTSVFGSADKDGE
ncbi:hypothetical protein L202_03299 [Cryptococcus amylolentus CBS 6039]|uniref:Uncharacterized protein n=1 Tax=Cryptococcus amylolentus CBS 6039 TaxID=1295533 RepID=A0A1E3HSH8_9TREE|nr:hypothetical protein L202_03299 [Cryptococcus amylolentus CBS 6039]ODN79287.1 hypothetical protein L202_03299 [Cryptococcus amylolentus CBS 6039]